MTDTTEEFFDELAHRGYEPRAATMRGSVRLDLRRGKRTERWLVSVDRGDVTVSRTNAAADAVVRMDEVRSRPSSAVRRTRWRRCSVAR